jgi:hypothetical protein
VRWRVLPTVTPRQISIMATDRPSFTESMLAARVVMVRTAAT